MKYLIEVVEEEFVTVAFAEPTVTIETTVVDTVEMSITLKWEDFDEGVTTGELIEYGIFRVNVMLDEVLWDFARKDDEVIQEMGICND